MKKVCIMWSVISEFPWILMKTLNYKTPNRHISYGLSIILLLLSSFFVFSSPFRCYLHMLQNIKIILLHWNIEFAHRECLSLWNMNSGYLNKVAFWSLYLYVQIPNSFSSSRQIFWLKHWSVFILKSLIFSISFV